MAAIDLARPLPSVRKQTSVGTTLQAFNLPSGARQVTIQADAAVYVQFTGADGDSVSSTAHWPVAANTPTGWALSTQPPAAVLVAAQSGTATVYVSVEGAL